MPPGSDVFWQIEFALAIFEERYRVAISAKLSSILTIDLRDFFFLSYIIYTEPKL